MPEPDRAAVSPEDALDTYRYLRAGMVVMVGMLALGVGIEWINSDYTWQTSISAYYYTAARGAFVAALCAIGVQLIVYKGSKPTEDTYLNLAGILAFIVAFVPTNPPGEKCDVRGPAVEWRPAITNNVASVMVAMILAGAVLWIVYRSKNKPLGRSIGGWISLAVLWLVVGIGAYGFLCHRKVFDCYAHNVAAIVMFGSIIVTVVINATLARQQTTPNTKLYFWLYIAIAAAMIRTLVDVLLIYRLSHGHWGHWVLVIEAALIVEFGLYWVIQTVELWDIRSRKEVLPKPLQDAAEQGVEKPSPSGFADELRQLKSCSQDERVVRAI